MKNLLLCCCAVLVATLSYGQPNPFQKKFIVIDRYIDSFMKQWNIPGMALGIVYKDQLIYAKGYGYRDLEKKLPVDTVTIFPIASNTKLFTSTAACMLAGEGKLGLDQPVKNYLPSLHFYNDELNERVTLRDLLSHRTGLPRYDGLWIASAFTRKELIERITYMKPALGFREGYIYNNMMFAAAGTIMEAATNLRWEDIIKTKILDPLQMKATCFAYEDMIKSGNYADAYFEPDSTNKLQKLAFMAQSTALGAAGIIKSNIADMSHWMIAQLNGGRYKGQIAIPEAAIKQTLVPNNIADKEVKWDELSNPLYCLGRIIQTYKGYKIAMHTGSIDGYYSNLSFIPSENLAVFLVHNSVPAGSVRSIMALPIIDRLLSLSQTPWTERYHKDYVMEKATSKKATDSVKATQILHTVPSHPLKDYTGKYSNRMYGDLLIELQHDQLTILFRKQQSTLFHFHYDQFITKEELSGKPDFRISFITGSSGTIGAISMQPYGDPSVEFTRVKE